MADGLQQLPKVVLTKTSVGKVYLTWQHGVDVRTAVFNNSVAAFDQIATMDFWNADPGTLVHDPLAQINAGETVVKSLTAAPSVPNPGKLPGIRTSYIIEYTPPNWTYKLQYVTATSLIETLVDALTSLQF